MIVNGSSRRMYVMRRLAGILFTLHPLLSSRGIFLFSPISEWCIILVALLGCRQVVRRQVLVLVFGGSNPSIPTTAYFVAPLYNLTYEEKIWQMTWFSYYFD